MTIRRAAVKCAKGIDERQRSNPDGKVIYIPDCFVATLLAIAYGCCVGRNDMRKASVQSTFTVIASEAKQSRR